MDGFTTFVSLAGTFLILCVSLLMGKLFELWAPMATVATVSFFITFALMFIVNVLTPDEPS